MCVSELQVKEIVHKEIHLEVGPLRDQVNSAKNWLIGLLIGLLATIFGIGTWVGAIQSRVDTVEREQENFENRVEGKLERIENLLLQLSKDVSSK